MKKIVRILLFVTFAMLITTSCDDPLLEGEKTCKTLKELCEREGVEVVSCYADDYYSGEYDRYKFEGHFVYLSNTENWNTQASWAQGFNLDFMVRYKLGYTTNTAGKEVKKMTIWFSDKSAILDDLK